MRKTLAEYLALAYPLQLIPDPDEGGYVFVYPDLPGCMGQVETLDELAEHAREARQLWLEVAYERGKEIPLPSREEEYSGKFVVRLPRSLHRRLAESAQADGVSLNYYVGTLLAAGHAHADVHPRLDNLGERLDTIQTSLRFSSSGGPVPTQPVAPESVPVEG